jgi:hypothetical protein
MRILAVGENYSHFRPASLYQFPAEPDLTNNLAPLPIWTAKQRVTVMNAKMPVRRSIVTATDPYAAQQAARFDFPRTQPSPCRAAFRPTPSR